MSHSEENRQMISVPVFRIFFSKAMIPLFANMLSNAIPELLKNQPEIQLIKNRMLNIRTHETLSDSLSEMRTIRSVAIISNNTISCFIKEITSIMAITAECLTLISLSKDKSSHSQGME